MRRLPLKEGCALTAHRCRVSAHVLMRVRLAPRSECTMARPSPASPTGPFRTCVDERERGGGGSSRAFELLTEKFLGKLSSVSFEQSTTSYTLFERDILEYVLKIRQLSCRARIFGAYLCKKNICVWCDPREPSDACYQRASSRL